MHPSLLDLACPVASSPGQFPPATPFQALVRLLCPLADPGLLPTPEATHCTLQVGSLAVRLECSDAGCAVVLRCQLGPLPSQAWIERLLAANLARSGGVDSSLGLDEQGQGVLVQCLPFHHVSDREMVDAFQRFAHRARHWQRRLHEAGGLGTL